MTTESKTEYKTEFKTTYCRICESLCGMVAEVQDGRLVALRPDKQHPLSAGFACQKGIAFTEVVNDPDRVTSPLRRRSDGSFEEVDWDEALDDITKRLSEIHKRHGSGAVGWVAGTVAILHGWGHRGGGWRVANATGGVNGNDLTSNDPQDVESLSGMAWLTGVPIEVERS
jgi:anaerobic selenocysteine-containing dehydrogenase